MVLIMCFNYVYIHQIDKVKRQLGSDRPVSTAIVTVDKFLKSTGKGDDVWW
ncbi:hypothetical protein AHAS_Ahas07G0117000 [Arachis hypogaea]